MKAGRLDRCPHARLSLGTASFPLEKVETQPSLLPSSLQQREHLAIALLPSLSASLSFSDVGRQKNGVVEGGGISTLLAVKFGTVQLGKHQKFRKAAARCRTYTSTLLKYQW